MLTLIHLFSFFKFVLKNVLKVIYFCTCYKFLKLRSELTKKLVTPSLNCSREFRVCSVIGTKVTCFLLKMRGCANKKKYTGHININIYIEYKMYLQLPYVADNTFFMVHHAFKWWLCTWKKYFNLDSKQYWKLHINTLTNVSIAH